LLEEDTPELRGADVAGLFRHASA